MCAQGLTERSQIESTDLGLSAFIRAMGGVSRVFQVHSLVPSLQSKSGN